MLKKSISLLISFIVFLIPLSVRAEANGDNTAGAALHGENFIVKENMEFYSLQNSFLNKWKTGGGPAVNMSLDNSENAYSGKGNSLKCQYDFSKTDETVMSFYRDNVIFNEDLNGNSMGEGSKFSFWIKTENEIQLQVRFIDTISDYKKYTMTTKEITVLPGETFLIIDWADFIPSDKTVYHDYYAMIQPQFIFSSVASEKTGAIYIDEIGFITGDDATRRHGLGVVTPQLKSEKWVNKAGNAASIAWNNNSPRYCKDGNAASLKIDYTALKDGLNPNFYYNDGIKKDAESLGLFGENTVLSFWTWSSQNVILEVTYMDTSITNGQLVQCKTARVEISSGEAITNLNMKDLIPVGHAMEYNWVYQLQFTVSSSISSKNTGTLYIDSIGFYASGTDTVLENMLNEAVKFSLEKAGGILEISNYYSNISELQKRDITPYTLNRYNTLMAEYDYLSPFIDEVASEKNDNNYDRGTISFHTVFSRPEAGDYSVTEIGAVIHRGSLINDKKSLSIESENVLKASKPVEVQLQKTEITVVFKSGTPENYETYSYTGDGYFNTEYILRPYVILKSDIDGSIVILYGRTVSSQKSNNISNHQENIAKAFDDDTNTAWTAENTGKSSFIYEFESTKIFNTIGFSEIADVDGKYAITDYTVEIYTEVGKWKKIYSQDEMGSRIGVLCQTYNARKVRISINAGGIASVSEIVFEMGAKGNSSIKNASYYTSAGLSMAKIEENLGMMKNLTDVILFDYGSWNISGAFNFKEQSGGEAHVADTISAIRTQNNPPKIWFSIQNYDKNEISQIVSTEGITEAQAKNRLLCTPEARTRLVNFCVKLCGDYNLTGIDVDYEYPNGSVQWSNYNKFIIQLANALHAGGYKLSTALSAYGVDFTSEAIMAIDYVNIMAYDTEYSDTLGRHNTYNTSFKNIEYFRNCGFAYNQLILGSGFYGKTINSGVKETASYDMLCQRYFDAISRDRNMYGKYYCSGVTSTIDKVYGASRLGLGGVFSWTFLSDYKYDQNYSLNNAIVKALEISAK